MSTALTYLRSREWSMGNGQCPECHGVPESWYPHPCHMTPDSLGHEPTCALALSLRELGDTPLFKGDCKRADRYREGLSDDGIFVTVPKDQPLSPIELEYRAASKTRFHAILDEIVGERP